jgi:Protein of unknown function (DUF2889)
MPLPESPINRTRQHTRRVSYEGYLRDDGQWDLDMHLVDVKDQDYQLVSGLREAGVPVHDFWLRMTLTSLGEITEVQGDSVEMPYPGQCDRILPDYSKLVGLNLRHNFRLHLMERLGSVRGCSHLTELLAWAPTAAIQSMVSNRADYDPEAVKKPFQLDRCHALASHSDTVATFYPKWFKPLEAI